ncbi:hypothetical protein GCM10008927_15910 [Amylibacter ulvae]|uniref:DNA gyrase inhibitor YacG n=1 Tax=Paramylibacter ulvae TaxID=1651968 RepID=A0ABQ3D0X7_9RHOB|nr:DNA gyrase inhibitor YacG [Amylibacter ulvae]GHA51384.1 hypothetical protein GCM10008927_15910 [Amylibacter ulvae]
MTCPICEKEETEQFRPFCSKRCADLDLGKWLTGAYAIPAQETDEGDGMSSDTIPDESKLH